LWFNLCPKHDLDERRNLVSRAVERIRDSNDLIEIKKRPGADERSKAGAPKITVKDFDDPEARAMHDVDFDLSDSARALIRNGINIDDRTAVESALSDTAGYTHDPAVFARYVDEVIKTARHNMATGQTD
jgi:hypothetical protein